VRRKQHLHLSSVCLLSPERLPWWGYGFEVGFTHMSGFGVGAEVSPLFVRFLERSNDKCRDRKAFG